MFSAVYIIIVIIIIHACNVYINAFRSQGEEGYVCEIEIIYYDM